MFETQIKGRFGGITTFQGSPDTNGVRKVNRKVVLLDYQENSSYSVKNLEILLNDKVDISEFKHFDEVMLICNAKQGMDERHFRKFGVDLYCNSIEKL